MKRGGRPTDDEPTARAQTIQDIFIQDVLEDILHRCSTITLGRLSLLYKGAAVDTWSLAPRIEIERVARPYNTIIKHTGSCLKSLELHTYWEYPAVLAHLRDNCLRLRSLTLRDIHLLDSGPLAQDHIAILERVTELTIWDLQHTRSEEFATELLRLLSHVRQPCQLTHLAFKNVSDYDISGEVITGITAMLPSLRRVHFDRCLLPDVLRELASNCHDLEEVRITRDTFWIPTNDFVPKQFVASHINAMSGTKVGINIKLGPDKYLFSCLLKDSSFESVKDILAFLQTTGVRHPMNAGSTIDFTVHLVSSHLQHEFIPFLRQLESGSASPLLPSIEQLVSSPNLYQLWQKLVLSAPAHIFVEAARVLGVPAVPEPLLLDAMLRRVEWDCEYPRVLADMGLLNLHCLSNDHEDVLFQESTLGAFQWLVENIKESDVRNMLRLTRGGVSRRAIMALKNFDRLVLISDFYKDPSLLRFEDHAELFFVVKELAARQRPLDELQEIVQEPTLSAAARAVVLFRTMGYQDEGNYLTFWTNLMTSGGVEPDYFAAVPELFDCVFQAQISADRVVSTLRTIASSLLSQARSANSAQLETFLKCLVMLVLRPVDGSTSVLSDQDTNFVMVALFEPICQIYCSAPHVCPATWVMDQLRGWLSYDFDDAIATTLFSFGAGFHVPDLTLKCVDHIGDELAALMLWGSPLSLPKFVEACLDHMSVEEINAPRESGDNLMDLVLLETNALRFSDARGLISTLIARGARLSKDILYNDGGKDYRDDYPLSRFNKQALEWYHQARRSA
eukprot:TRINITY_DN1568_c0_g2_i1.p1 TRINITY_DN1568_c0_g2~~TRINITY_DN1568_c0_g2_i1.p1  ORF type:complete len:792 (+),score=77.81 TRINITY_DN1568_c0_g2_i1:97-2472(+)